MKVDKYHILLVCMLLFVTILAVVRMGDVQGQLREAENTYVGPVTDATESLLEAQALIDSAVVKLESITIQEE